MIGSAPVLVSVDNDVANAWAVYFLRRHAIRLLEYRGYMAQPHLKPLMDRAAPVDIASASYVLSDDGRAGGRDVVWQSGRFVLWRIPPSGAAFLVGVANPNGTERLNGRSFYWIGQGETIVDVVATADGAAALSASFVHGPSLPNLPLRRLRVATASGESRIFTIARDGAQSLIVPVRRGANRLVVRALDTPSTTIARDPRPLLVGMEGLTVSIGAVPGSETVPPEIPQNPTCSTTFVSGWHAREASDSGWLRWSSGTGRLRISATTEADFELSGDVLSFVRPNTIDVRINGKAAATWMVTDPAWAFHTVTPVRFHVAAGHTVTVDLVGRAKPDDLADRSAAARDRGEGPHAAPSGPAGSLCRSVLRNADDLEPCRDPGPDRRPELRLTHILWLAIGETAQRVLTTGNILMRRRATPNARGSVDRPKESGLVGAGMRISNSVPLRTGSNGIEYVPGPANEIVRSCPPARTRNGWLVLEANTPTTSSSIVKCSGRRAGSMMLARDPSVQLPALSGLPKPVKTKSGSRSTKSIVPLNRGRLDASLQRAFLPPVEIALQSVGIDGCRPTSRPATTSDRTGAEEK